jgi:hypothetical protein
MRDIAMDYLGTIRNGFRITWDNKFLWVLGFLAALGSGAGGFSNSNFRFDANDPQQMQFMQEWLTPERIAAMTAGLAAFACIAFIVGIILWLVNLGARGGLISAVAQLESGAGKPSFGSAFRAGWRHVLRLVGMSIVLFVLPLILFIIVFVGFFAVAGGAALVAGADADPGAVAAGIGGLALVFLCLLCLLIPVFIVLNLINAFAFRGIVLRDLGVMDSIRHGWRVTRQNLGEILLLVLAFFLINIIIIIVTAAILAPIVLIFGVPFVALMDSGATALQGVLAVLGIVVGMVVYGLIAAIATAWQSATFTLAYLQWTGRNGLKDSAAPLAPAAMS